MCEAGEPLLPLVVGKPVMHVTAAGNVLCLTKNRRRRRVHRDLWERVQKHLLEPNRVKVPCPEAPR